MARMNGRFMFNAEIVALPMEVLPTNTLPLHTKCSSHFMVLGL